jgi:thiol-disulfide isomerase/thioredoxin
LCNKRKLAEKRSLGKHLVRHQDATIYLLVNACMAGARHANNPSQIFVRLFARVDTNLRRSVQGRIAVPAGLLTAGASTQAQAAISQELLRSTIQIAQGLTAGNSAAVLARGVLNAMLLKQVKIVAGLLLIGAATCLTAGLAWALGPGPRAKVPAAGPDVAVPAARSAAQTPKRQRRQLQVHGVVVDEAGQPVAGVPVQAYAYTDREARSVTDENGSFTIPSPGPQLNDIPLLARTADGNRSGIVQYDIATNEEINARTRIVLKASRVIIVRVADSSKAPVSGASAQISGVFFVCDGATTGRDGTARLRIPADAKVEWAFALKSGIGFDYAEFGHNNQQDQSPGGLSARELPTTVSLTLDGARTARIKAIDRNGTPLAGVAFAPWLLHKDGRRSQLNVFTRITNVTTGPDGVATFDWLPPSKDALTFWPLSQDYAHRRVQLEEGQSATVTAKMIRAETIRGRVVYPDGQPASGILIRAYGSGQSMDNCQAQDRTNEDGSYEMSVSPREAYAVYVDDKDWAAPSRLDVVIREGKPAERVDFKLSRGTLIRGTVVVGPGNQPVPNHYISLDETGGSAPEDLREKGDHFAREVRRQFSTTTDSSGRYSIRVGPGTYTLMGPPRTNDEKITIKVDAEAELDRDFLMPRPEKGTLTGRVVGSGHNRQGIAGARIEIVAESSRGLPVMVTADTGGQFHAERQLDPLVIHAATPDGKLGAVVEVGAQDTEIVIPLAPTATATGILVDEHRQPVVNTKLYWGRQVFQDEDRSVSSMHFAPKVVTDSAGRFTLPSLVVGQEYGISIQRDNAFPAAGAVRPEKAERIELGTLQVGAYHRNSPATVEEMSSFTKTALGPGAVAPPIEAITLDGRPIKLAEYKGKFVLLDFWATWCGPCVAEIPQLQAVHDAFGNDERFAILSLSVDEKLDEPKKFQEKRKLPWAQAFLGGGIQGPTPGTFGVRAIPAFVLVGPDGKIIARGMRGDDIKKEVEKALQSQAVPER